MAGVAAAGRADLTDAQWAVLHPLLPVGARPGRPPKWSKRQLSDGTRWRVRVGAPWRDVPPGYGPWQTVYGVFRRRQRAGVRRRTPAALQARADAGGRSLSLLVTAGQGLQLQGQPRLPATPRDQGDHRPALRPGHH
ncbi:transposase [Saccharothrix sp. DSM 118769]